MMIHKLKNKNDNISDDDKSENTGRHVMKVKMCLRKTWTWRLSYFV